MLLGKAAWKAPEESEDLPSLPGLRCFVLLRSRGSSGPCLPHCAVGVKGQTESALPSWRAPAPAKASMACLAPLTRVLAGRSFQRMLHKRPLNLGLTRENGAWEGARKDLGQERGGEKLAAVPNVEETLWE